MKCQMKKVIYLNMKILEAFEGTFCGGDPLTKEINGGTASEDEVLDDGAAAAADGDEDDGG